MQKLKEIISWRGFWMTWVLLAVIVAAFVVSLTMLEARYLFIEGILLLVVFALVFISMYRAATMDRDTTVERSELRSILKSLNDALIVYELGFKAIFFNAAAENLFGVSAKDIIGHVFSPRDVEKGGWQRLAQIIFPSLAPRVVPHSKEGEYPQVSDISFTDPQLELRVTTAPVVDETGKTLAFVKIIHDRTAQIAALKARGEFITVASHQLRGPVTDINWALQTLEAAEELSETSKIIVDTAFAASQGLLRRIEDLLNIAKIEDGQFGYAFEDTDVIDFVGKILSDVLPAARKANVKVYFDRPAQGLPHVMIDPKHLSLALVNILENAIRYNVANGEVIVKADKMPDKPFVVVSVKDTGIGIPPDSLGKLFSKFYRADNAMKTQTEGSGLGLYIAKSIVNAHGGQITAESELQRGTTVSIALPTDPNLVPRKEVGSTEALI